MPKDKEIIFTKTFPVGMCWEKASITQELLPGDDAISELIKLKARIEGMYIQEQQAPVQQQKKPDLTPDEAVIQQIMLCSSIPVLKGFEKLSRLKPSYQEAYENRFKHLQLIEK